MFNSYVKLPEGNTQLAGNPSYANIYQSGEGSNGSN